MATFSDNELDYLRGQRLARLATSDAAGAPHVVPVGFRLSDDGDAIDVGGHNLAGSKKYRNLTANPKVAIVIDDLASVDPWTPRGLEVRGNAELHDDGGGDRFGQGWDEAWVRIMPERVISWGIEAPPFTPGELQRPFNTAQVTDDQLVVAIAPTISQQVAGDITAGVPES